MLATWRKAKHCSFGYTNYISIVISIFFKLVEQSFHVPHRTFFNVFFCIIKKNKHETKTKTSFYTLLVVKHDKEIIYATTKLKNCMFFVAT